MEHDSHRTILRRSRSFNSEMEPDLDGLLCDLKSRIGTGADRALECVRPRLVMRSPAPNEREIQMPARKIASQVRDLVREEIHSMREVREFGGASSE